MISEIADRRAAAVAETMDDIRTIEAANVDVGTTGRAGPTRAGVEAIRDRLIELAHHRDLFPLDDFPGPSGPDSEGRTSRSRLYRMAQDADDRFALYAQRSVGDVSTPPHNHTTWAVVVGFEGQELNRFYRRVGDGGSEELAGDGGVAETHQHVVEAGTGVAMLGDDLHSIHIGGSALNFHCYGLALERLDDRVYYDVGDGEWKSFAAVSNIVEARPGLQHC